MKEIAIISLSDITVGDRQRTRKSGKLQRELEASIRSDGLMYPIVVWETPRGERPYKLIAGGRRLEAIANISEPYFTATGDEIYPGTIPALVIPNNPSASPTRQLELELLENVIREQLHWQDEVRALAEIARISDAEGKTRTETAKELATKLPQTTETIRGKLNEAIMIADAIERGDETVLRARSINEAHKTVLAQNELRFREALAALETHQTNHKLICGDCIKEIPQLEACGGIDLIIADPPYGIDADGTRFGVESTTSHPYSDNPAYMQRFMQDLFRVAFEALKPIAGMFVFCDYRHFLTLRDMAKRAGYSTWDSPIIWNKVNHSDAPWGRGGFLRSYEMLLYCCKGQKQLFSPGSDIIACTKLHPSQLTHPAEKPVALYRKLIEISTVAGDIILDPCCGSGPIFPAAEELARTAIGIERDKQTYRLANKRLQETIKKETTEESAQ